MAVIGAALALLMFSAINSTASSVVIVRELKAEGQTRARLRLGARVADETFDYHSQPTPILKFAVHDIGQPQERLSVVYNGLLPDTLKAGRDVILEGSFDGTTFTAASLVTQCPSKYVPPQPKAERN